MGGICPQWFRGGNAELRSCFISWEKKLGGSKFDPRLFQELRPSEGFICLCSFLVIKCDNMCTADILENLEKYKDEPLKCQ